MALPAGLFHRHDEQVGLAGAVRVVAHAATRQFMRFVAVPPNELLAGVACLASSTESKAASTAHAVAVRARGLERRMIGVRFDLLPCLDRAGMEHDLLKAAGRLEPDCVPTRRHCHPGMVNTGERLRCFNRLAVHEQATAGRLGNNLDFFSPDPRPVWRLDDQSGVGRQGGLHRCQNRNNCPRSKDGFGRSTLHAC